MRMQHVTSVAVGGLLALLAGACGDDPVSYSAPVGIILKAKSGDTMNGVVSDEKSINTESGNPYGVFVSDAHAKLGRDPSLIEVEGVELLLGGGSTGAATLGEVFNGTVDILFQMNDTNTTYPVAQAAVAASTSAGPVSFDTRFDGEAVPDADYVKLLGGSFKVIARGPAAPTFAGKGADVNLQITLTFSAFE